MLTALALLALADPNATDPKVAGDWIDLFDGRDLAGWTYEGTPGGVRIEDGVLVLQSAGPGRQAGHLFYVGDDPSRPRRFRDLELELVSRGEPNSNSGLFFHTTRRLSNRFGLLADGYEAQLTHRHKATEASGSLYAVVDLDSVPVDCGDWFTMRIRVRGQTIDIFLNDEPVVHYVEPPNPERPKKRAGRVLRPDGGLIALQAHDTESRWLVRSLRIRELPAATE